MKAFAIATMLGASLALTACQTNPKIDDAIQKNLPQLCTGGEVLHAAFLVVAGTGKVSEKLIKNEAAAYAGLAEICRDPESVNSVTALLVATRAYAAVVAATKAAE